MSEDNVTDAALESSIEFSNVQNYAINNEDAEQASQLTDRNAHFPLSKNPTAARVQNLDSLRENLSKQQERLSALRDRALKKSEDGRRKSSANDSMESLKTLGQKLTVLKARNSGSGLSPEAGSRNESFDSYHILAEMAQRPDSSHLGTPNQIKELESPTSQVVSGSEKLLMLTQRTEQNRALLEQRKRDMAKSVQSVKSNLAGKATELGSSMTDLRSVASVGNTPVSRHRSAADLQLQQQRAEQFDEARLKLLKNKIKLTELKEKRKDQELQQELLELRNELNKRDNIIEDLQTQLAQQSGELCKQNSSEPDQLQTEIDATRQRNSKLESINDMLEKSHSGLHDELLSTREQLNTAQAKLESLEQEQSKNRKSSLGQSVSTGAQVNAELAKQVQDLEKQLNSLKTENEALLSDSSNNSKLQITDASISERLSELETIIESQRQELNAHNQTIASQEEDLAEKTTELNVLNVNLRVLEEKLMQSSKNKSIFLPTVSDEDANLSEQLKTELKQLKQKLDESNKTNIKLKLKSKQTEKQMEKLKNSSELQKELTRLSEENDKLQQQLTVLEDEKGQWQLSQMHDTASEEDTAPSSEFVKQQAETIRLLEEQKLELQQALQALQMGSESARVESELSEVQLEEQLSQRVQELETMGMEQQQKLQQLQSEKDALDKKLTHYINENMELLDKLEKLSSSSSAESIEIVERPTQQERAELERFNKRRPASEGDEHESQQDDNIESNASTDVLPSFVNELTQTDMAPEVSESLAQLREESAELVKKIELFSTERREVLEKMEYLTSENTDLQSRLEQYGTEVRKLETAKSNLEQELEQVHKEKNHLSTQISESNMQRSNQTQELSSMQKSSEVVAAIDCGGEGSALFDKCEKSLSKLNSELEAYRIANDRNTKLNVSKKLAKEAKNVHKQLTELLLKVKEASHAVETVTVVETVVAVTAPNGKALAEYEQLTAQNTDLKNTVAALEMELNELRDSHERSVEPVLAIAAPENTNSQQHLQELEAQCTDLQSTVEELHEQLRELRTAESERTQLIAEKSEQITDLQLQIEQFDYTINSKEMAYEKQIEQLTRVRCGLESQNDAYERELSILQTLVKEQKQQLIEAYSESEHKLNLKLLEIQQCNEDITALRNELAQRPPGDDNGLLSEECSKLKESLRISKSLAAQQVIELSNKQETIDLLNKQIIELYQGIEEKEQSMKINDSQAAQQVIELSGNQDTIASLNKQIVELLQGLEEKSQSLIKAEEEITALKTKTEQQLLSTSNQAQEKQQLELQIKQLQECNAASETNNKELREKLKKYAANLKKRSSEISQLEKKLAELTENNNKLVPETQTQLQSEKPNEQNNQELLELKQLLHEEQSTVAKLNEELKHKIHLNLENRDVIKQLKHQLLEVVSQSAKQEDLQRLQVELQNAVQSNAQLRQESSTLQAQWEHNERELREHLAASECTRIDAEAKSEALNELRRQLEAKSTKFDKSKEVIKHRNATIQNLQRELTELRNQLQAQPEELETEQSNIVAMALEDLQAQHKELQHQHESLKEQYANEKANFEQTIARLETIHEGIQAKLQEDMNYIESLEAENNDLKVKTASLQEQLTAQIQEQETVEGHKRLFDQQLNEREVQFEEHKAELLKRVQMLSDLEQNQSHQIEELKSDADEARYRHASVQSAYDELLVKHNKLTSDVQSERDSLANRSDEELETLREQLHAREIELQRQRASYDAKLAVKTTELDELECDLSAHMERATAETRDLTQQLERAQEQLNNRSDELTKFNEDLSTLERERSSLSREVTFLRLQQDSAEQDALELQELRMQVLQDKTEMDNLRGQIDSLCTNHNQELQSLMQQIAELDTLGQNQTDDQVYIQTENKRLADQLAELQARLEQYERASASDEQSRELAEKSEQVLRLQSELALLRGLPPRHPVDTFSAQSSELISAPAMFFNSDLAAPSPFDELVQPRLTATQLGVGVSSPIISALETPAFSSNINEQPTIEDLQRNVSDLEKHAQDLETKLLARNQSIAEYEERQRDAVALERHELQQRQQIEHYMNELKMALEERNGRLSSLEAQLAEATQASSKRLTELEHLLHSREQEIAELRASIEERERLATLEKMIQPDPPQSAPTLDMFFGTENESVTDSIIPDPLTLQHSLEASTQPVVEELITPKKAYICHPQETQLAVDWGVDEDPWESAAAEEAVIAHIQSPLDVATNAKVADLESRLATAEQQKSELQTKTAKLMKRLKEYKSKAATADSNDLDSAIIEELKHQIQLHESKQSKTEELLQQYGLEKEKLIKRIDVLTAGNDRMAELKERQDMDVQMYQARIRELQEKLNQLNSWGEESKQTTLVSTPTTVQDDGVLSSKLDELQAENQELNVECQDLQTQLQSEKLNAQRAQDAATQAQNEREELRDQLQRLSTELSNLQQEKQKLMEKAATETATSSVKTTAVSNDEHVALLQEKESEILHLKQRIEELMREDQTEKLVFEILTKNQELHLLRMQVKQFEEEKHELEATKVSNERDSIEPVSNQTSSTNDLLEKQLEEMRVQNGLLEQEKTDMEEELRVLNNHVLSTLELEDKMKQCVLELDAKKIEITELRKTLEQLQQAQEQTMTQSQSLTQAAVNFDELNQQWEAAVEQKCSEVAKIWQEHLAQREADFKSTEQELRSQIAQLHNQPKADTEFQNVTAVEEFRSIASTDSSHDLSTGDSNNMLMKMQKALETQEMEIVTLKEQLAIRSAEYARLAAQYDPFRLQNTLSGSTSTANAGSTLDPLPEYVLKADLDYALMMVHQRDMRVEEMILELVQLLEERDHLQLKLSDTLRQLETERSRPNEEPAAVAASLSSNSATASSSTASGSPSKISSSSDLSGVTGASGSDLKQKLAELQTVKHSKDKAIVDEREQRLQQMIQLHKPGVTTSSAATTSVASTSVDVQQPGVDLSQPSLRSPSMTLVDWILGNNKNEDDGQHQLHN